MTAQHIALGLIVLFVLLALVRVKPIEDIVAEEVDDPRHEDALAITLNGLRNQSALYQHTELACMFRRSVLPSWVTLDMCEKPAELERMNNKQIAARRPIVVA